MRCSNAPFTEYGQSEIIRDVEYLYMLLAGGTNDLNGQTALPADQTVGDDTVNGQGGVPSPAAQQAANDALYLQIAQDLADVHNAATARSNLGLGSFHYASGTNSYQFRSTGNARGSGAMEIAIGTGSTATQVASGAASFIAGGLNNTSSGQSAFAAGDTCIASGQNSFAFGHSCTASGTNSICGGASSSTTNGGASLGSTNTNTAAFGIALGFGNSVTGDDGVAIGSGNLASGIPSYVLGANCTVSHADSMALGISVSSTVTGELTLGFTSGIKTNGDFYRNGVQILNTQQAAVTPAAGTLAQATTAINDLISRLQAHGLIA